MESIADRDRSGVDHAIIDSAHPAVQLIQNLFDRKDVRKGTALDSEITGIEVSTADENQDTAASTQAGAASTEASEQASRSREHSAW